MPARSGNAKPKKVQWTEEGPAVFVEPDYEEDWAEVDVEEQKGTTAWARQKAPMELVEGTLVVAVRGRSNTFQLQATGCRFSCL